MIKLLMVGDSPTIDSGFGRVNRKVAEYLYKTGEYDIQFVGWCYQGQKHDYPFIIHPVDVVYDYWGKTTFDRVIKQWKPDIVYTLGDIWMIDWIAKHEYRSEFKWLGYIPIDGIPIPFRWREVINNMDMPVVFSKFAYDNLRKVLLKKHIDFIYHGVDTEIFHPVQDKYEHKKKYNLHNKYVIGIVARNQKRKNIPALLKAFAKFSKNKPDTVLYLHMCLIENVGWNIPELLKLYDLGQKGKVVHTEGLTPAFGVPDHLLVEIYNLFDLFVLPTMGEGFGLPVLEAQACEVPVLVTDYSACTELVQDKSQLIKVKDYIVLEEGVEHAIVDIDDLVDKMNFFYSHQKLARTYGKKGREFARTMRWERVLPRFDELMKLLYNS